MEFFFIFVEKTIFSGIYSLIYTLIHIFTGHTSPKGTSPWCASRSLSRSSSWSSRALPWPTASPTSRSSLRSCAILKTWAPAEATWFSSRAPARHAYAASRASWTSASTTFWAWTRPWPWTSKT